MCSIAWLFFLAMPVFDQTIPEAQALKQEGQYFMAEAVLLGGKPAEADIPVIAGHLCDIAFRLGTHQEKKAFYRSLLVRTPEWRKVSFYVLAAFAAKDREWEVFRQNASLYLREYRPESGRDVYDILYNLARYTTQSPESLNLSPLEQVWFDACRNTPSGRIFPVGLDARFPYELRFFHLTEADGAFELAPAPVEGDSDTARYVSLLISAKNGIVGGELNRAAIALNELLPLDRNLDQYNLRVHLQRVLIEFHQIRGNIDRARSTQSQLEKTLARTILPYLLHSGDLVTAEMIDKANAASQAEPSSAVSVVTPPPEEPIENKPVAVADSLQSLELLLKRRKPPEELEARIKDLKGNTVFKQIYKDYLLGLFYLKRGRLKTAYPHLSDAEGRVAALPFPILETKILLALGAFYDREGNSQQANWYRIAASQVWASPTCLPILTFWRDYQPVNPYRALIDRALEDANDADRLNSLLLFREANHLYQVRYLAFRRNALNGNAVLNNQLQDIGLQLAAQVRGLAQSPDSEPNPKRYNDTLDIWNQLWSQVLPFYRDGATPSSRDIQNVTPDQGLTVAFVEGDALMGALIFSPNQAFAVNLGYKKRYMELNDDQRFSFLESLLGPIWEQRGGLTLVLSDVFKKTGLLERLMPRLSEPARFRVGFSLRSLAASSGQESTAGCLNHAVFSEKSDGTILDIVSLLPRSGLSWYAEQAVTAAQITRALDSHDHLLYQGPVGLNKDGFYFGREEDPFHLNHVIQHNDSLCSLTIVTRSFERWGEALTELELVNRKSPMILRIAGNLNAVKDDMANNSGSGTVIRFY